MSDQALRVRNWLTQAALPLWANAGVDFERGGFVERLTRAGKPDLAAPKRVRVQARQIYVYSHAAILGLWPAGAELALNGFEFLERHARLADGGFVHLLDRSGRVIDARRDAYDQAFVLHALAWLYRATKVARVEHAIAELLAALDASLTDRDSGGFFEDDRGTLPRRQNPHMHLFEAFLALYATTRDSAFLSRARMILDLFRNHFFDAGAGVVREYFTERWTPAPGEAGRIVEPGHHFEWIWLLEQWARAAGTVPPVEAEALARFANNYGCELGTGLAYDELWDDGRVKRTSKRCWPQTEALKAELVLAEKAGRGITPRADAILHDLFRYYLDPAVPGGWIDVLDAANLPASEYIPASTFYHVFLAFAEYLRIAEA